MHLNTLKPKAGSRQNAKRVGRGIGSGRGKTCGRGHKGQKSRSGGKVARGFEGGQMPLYRRLPKSGFTHDNKTAQVRLGELQKIDSAIINLQVLQDAGVVAKEATTAKVFLSGAITKVIKLEGILMTKGARKAIEDAGGSITEAATAA